MFLGCDVSLESVNMLKMLGVSDPNFDCLVNVINPKAAGFADFL